MNKPGSDIYSYASRHITEKLQACIYILLTSKWKSEQKTIMTLKYDTDIIVLIQSILLISYIHVNIIVFFVITHKSL